MVSIVLTSEDIADMDLYLGGWDSQESIAQGHGGVAVTAEVDDESIGRETHLLNTINKFSFHIALVMGYLHVREEATETVDILLHRSNTIDLGFTTASEIEVGPIDNFNMFHRLLTVEVNHNIVGQGGQ